MKIKFERSGGFAGITTKGEFEVAPDDLATATDLLQKVAAKPAPPAPVVAAGADMMTYHVEVTGGEDTTIDVGDSGAQDEHHALFDFILARI